MDATWLTGDGEVSLREPLFLGIVNVTPDSFSDGGRFLAPGDALAQAEALVRQGAGALDLGAESTRPGAAPVDPETEWARLEPVLARVRAGLPRVPVSLDTRHAPVAVRGLRGGAAAINDQTGFRDPALLEAVAGGRCGLIAMRSRMEGGAFVMPPYDRPDPDQPAAAVDDLRRIRDRLLDAGIAPGRILLDPGFGFGTSFAGDLALWEALPRLPEALEWPVERFCLGISRKRFLAWRAGRRDLPPAQRDALTQAAHQEAMALGYRVFRTHQVRQTVGNSA
jgi:dihydropteroate synthase